MKLYRWQRACLAAWEENGRRGIVHVATGAGKTVFALAAIRSLRDRFPDLEVKVVVPTIPLARQWFTALTHDAPNDAWRPGLYGGDRRDGSERRVMVYVVNSARDALAAHARRAFALNHHILLICDECHHFQSPQNRRVFDFVTQDVLDGKLYACIGLSATPFGTGDDAVLTRALGGEIYRYGTDNAVEDGVLSRFSVCEIGASFSHEELDAYCQASDELARLLRKLLALYPDLESLDEGRRLQGIRRLAREADMDPSHPAAAYLLWLYRRKEISHLAESRINCCLSLLEHMEEGTRVLMFCERITQAEALLARVRLRWSARAGIYHSQMSREARARNMDAFRTGELRALISCRCLDEGIDVPEASVGIVLSGAAVVRQRVQRLGRILRTAPGKDAACLYYIYIRESADDAAFLPGLEQGDTFSLRYYTAEDAFSNDVYEYAASRLLDRARDWPPEQRRELRDCLLEGLTRADWLLSGRQIDERVRRAATRHARNYWQCMARMAVLLRGIHVEG